MDLRYPIDHRRGVGKFALAALLLAPAILAQPAPDPTLRQAVADARLADLRWPDFSDYRGHVTKFYEQSSYAFAWTHDGRPTAQARAIISVLQGADAKGLGAEDYDASRWPGRLQHLDAGHAPPPDLARFDLALTVSVMRYISDLHIGKLNPKLFHFGFDIEEKKYDLPDLLRNRLVNAPDAGAVLAQVEPPFPAYRRTQKALQDYMVLAKQDDGEKLPAITKPVAPGDTYAGVPRLVRLLRRVGDLPADAAVSPDSQVYQGPLVDAVKRFQDRHGLEPDGRIGKPTLEQLNTPLSFRVRQLQLTLERWRWVPHDFARPPIIVNVPEFRLRGLDTSLRADLEMNVVVGRAYGHQTPVFSGDMRFVIFRPYWNVPASIQRGEMLPKLKKDPAYLAKNGFEVVTREGQVVGGGTVSDDTLAGLRSLKLSVRQVPGAKNALGSVKFLFPNEHDVYLHGTPAQALFSRARRDFSHGCIRLEKPDVLAQWVLQDKPEWTMDRIHVAMNGAKPVEVKLDRTIPVLIVYGTAVARENGEVCFYEDIYGHDASMEKLLEKGYPYPY